MLAALNIGPFISFAILFAIVLTIIVVSAAKAQDRKRGDLRPNARPPLQPQPQRRPSPEATRRPMNQAAPAEDVDSDEAESVAENLAQDYLDVAHSKTLVKPDERAAAAKPLFSLRDADDIRRAFILNEVLGKPKALRRR